MYHRYPSGSFKCRRNSDDVARSASVWCRPLSVCRNNDDVTPPAPTNAALSRPITTLALKGHWNYAKNQYFKIIRERRTGREERECDDMEWRSLQQEAAGGGEDGSSSSVNTVISLFNNCWYYGLIVVVLFIFRVLVASFLYQLSLSFVNSPS